MQAPDLTSTLDLVGSVIHELLAADGAILLLSLGDQEYRIAFDHRGSIKPVLEDTAPYQCARQAMRDKTPILLPNVAADPKIQAGDLSTSGSVSLLAFPFPPIKPVCVLAAFWHRRRGRHQLAEQIPVLRYISELSGAALGNINLKQDLEKRILDRTKEITKTLREHADELQQRDHVEAEIQRISVTDVLTGMLSRRGFFLHAEQSFRVARRQGCRAH
jgi:hypothetical protein